MNENKSSLVVPIAIVICLLLIAAAVYFKDRPRTLTPANTGVDLSQLLPEAERINLNAFRPIDASDKIFGETDAPIKLVVYTDLECPACKYFHEQVKLLEAEYITSGQVALVYREFPLDSIHPTVRDQFMAAECVRELGGNEKYWQFMDRIFEITPSNNSLDLAKLGETAEELEINSEAYTACTESDKYADAIQMSLDEVVTLGGQGTPFWLIVTDKQISPFYGAVGADRLSAALNLILKDMAEVEEEIEVIQLPVEETEEAVTATSTN